MAKDSITITPTEDLEPIYRLTFILLLIAEIPSIICVVLVLVYFFSHWDSMITKALPHHAIFLLLIVSFLYVTLDLPCIINHYRRGYDNLRAPSFCLSWYWLDYTLLTSSLFLTATASIQRHILIFNAHSLRLYQKRWLLHFSPLIISVVYPSLFYFIAIFFYPCTTPFDDDALSCPFPCYSREIIILYVDWILNTICPVIVIVVANSTLVYRVIYSMRRTRQRRSRIWLRQRKLTLQLLAFTSLYIIGWTPSVAISILQITLCPNLFDERPSLYYINNSNYFVCPLQPFICFFALPDLISYIRGIFKRGYLRSN